jgi:hypothetical protein
MTLEQHRVTAANVSPHAHCWKKYGYMYREKYCPTHRAIAKALDIHTHIATYIYISKAICTSIDTICICAYIHICTMN